MLLESKPESGGKRAGDRDRTTENRKDKQLNVLTWSIEFRFYLKGNGEVSPAFQLQSDKI